MLVTCDTSHSPIGLCSLVGRLSSEETPSLSSTARLSSSRDFAENTGNAVMSAFFVGVEFWLCDVILVTVLISVVCQAFSLLFMLPSRRASYPQACVVTLYKIANIRRKTAQIITHARTHAHTREITTMKKRRKVQHASKKNTMCSNNFRTPAGRK